MYVRTEVTQLETKDAWHLRAGASVLQMNFQNVGFRFSRDYSKCQASQLQEVKSIRTGQKGGGGKFEMM